MYQMVLLYAFYVISVVTILTLIYLCIALTRHKLEERRQRLQMKEAERNYDKFYHKDI